MKNYKCNCVYVSDDDMEFINHHVKAENIQQAIEIAYKETNCDYVFDAEEENGN